MWSIALLCSFTAAHPHHGLTHSGGNKVVAAAPETLDCTDSPTQQPTPRLSNNCSAQTHGVMCSRFAQIIRSRDRSGAGHGSLLRSNGSALSQFGKWLRCASIVVRS